MCWAGTTQPSLSMLTVAKCSLSIAIETKLLFDQKHLTASIYSSYQYSEIRMLDYEMWAIRKEKVTSCFRKEGNSAMNNFTFNSWYLPLSYKNVYNDYLVWF